LDDRKERRENRPYKYVVDYGREKGQKSQFHYTIKKMALKISYYGEVNGNQQLPFGCGTIG